MGNTCFETAREILEYARKEFERAEKLRDIFLYRSAADKAFLALVVAVNEYIRSVKGIEPRSHSERRRILREMRREDLRAIYSDVMRPLHAMDLVAKVIDELEAEVEKMRKSRLK